MEELVYLCPTHGNSVLQNGICFRCVCPTCLSKHRILYHLGGQKRDILLKLGIIKMKMIQMICWECYAMVENIIRFKRTALQAQRLLLSRNMLSLNSLENLSRLRKTKFIKVLSILPKDKGQPVLITRKPGLQVPKLHELNPTTIKHNESTSQVQNTKTKPYKITAKRSRATPIEPQSKEARYTLLLEKINRSQKSGSTSNKANVAVYIQPVEFAKDAVKVKQNNTTLGTSIITTLETSDSSLDDTNVNKSTETLLAPLEINHDGGTLDTNISLNNTRVSKSAEIPLEDFALINQNVTTLKPSDIVTLETSGLSLIDVNILETATVLYDDSAIITQSGTTTEKLDITPESTHNAKTSKTDMALLEDSALRDQTKLQTSNATLETSELPLKDVNNYKTADILLEGSLLMNQNVVTPDLTTLEISNLTTPETLESSLNDVEFPKKAENLLKNSDLMNQSFTTLETNLTTLETSEFALNDVEFSKTSETPLKDSSLMNQSVTTLKTDFTTLERSESTLNDVKISKKFVTPPEDPLLRIQSLTTVENDVSTRQTSELPLNDVNITKRAETMLEHNAVITQDVTTTEASDVTTIVTSESSLNDMEFAERAESPLKDSLFIKQRVTTRETDVTTLDTPESALNDAKISNKLKTPFEDSLLRIPSIMRVEKDVTSRETSESQLNDMKLSKRAETLLDHSAEITQNVKTTETLDVTTIVTSESPLKDDKISKAPGTLLKNSLVIINQSVIKIGTSDSTFNVNHSETAETSLDVLVTCLGKLTLCSIDDEIPSDITAEKNFAAIHDDITVSVQTPVNSCQVTNELSANKYANDKQDFSEDTPFEASSCLSEISNNCDMLLCNEEFNDSLEDKDGIGKQYLENEIPKKYLENNTVDGTQTNNPYENITQQDQKKPKHPTVIKKLGSDGNNVKNVGENIPNIIDNSKCVESNTNTIIKHTHSNDKRNIEQPIEIDTYTIAEPNCLPATEINKKFTGKNTYKKRNIHKNNDINLEKNAKTCKQQLVVNRITADCPWKSNLNDTQINVTRVVKKNTQHTPHMYTFNYIRVKKVNEINGTDTLKALKKVELDHTYSKNKWLNFHETYQDRKTNRKRPINESVYREIMKRLNWNEEQDTSTTGVLTNEQLEVSIIEDWEKELPNVRKINILRNAGIRKQLHKPRQVTSIRNPVLEDVLSIDNSADHSSIVSISDNDVDVRNIGNTQENTHKRIKLITDIKVEQCNPEYVEENNEINRDFDWSVDRCKIEQEEIDIKAEHLLGDDNSSTTNSAPETDYLENVEREQAFNYDNSAPTETYNSTLSYYDYHYKPLDPCEKSPRPYDDGCLQNEPDNATSNCNDKSNDFVMDNIVVCFSSSLFDIDPTTEFTDEYTDDLNPKATNISKDTVNTTEDLLEPRYYTDWSGETFEHHLEEIPDSSKVIPRKKVSDQTNTDDISSEFENNVDKFKDPSQPKRKRKKGLLLTKKKNKSRLKRKYNKTLKLVSKELKNDSQIMKDEKPLNETNFEKLLLRPVVLLERIDAVIKDRHNLFNQLFPDEPTGKEEILAHDQLNVNVESLNDLTTDLFEDVRANKALDQLQKINKANKLKGKKMYKNERNKSNLHKKRCVKNTIDFSLRTLQDDEIEKLRTKIKNEADFKNATFKCFTCIRKFEKKCHLIYHNIKYHEAAAGSVVCDVCDCRFKDKSKLKRHNDLHIRCYKCCWCANEYMNVKQLTCHVEEMHPAEYEAGRGDQQRTYTCTICDVQYNNRHSIWYHQKSKHNSQNKTSLTKKNSSLTENIYNFSENNSSLTETDSILKQNDTACSVCDMKFRTTFANKRHFATVHTTKNVGPL